DTLPKDDVLIKILNSKQQAANKKQKAIELTLKKVKLLQTHYRNNKEPTSTQWSHVYRESLTKNHKTLDALPKITTIKSILTDHGLLNDNTSSFNTITSNEQWLTLQHYSHAAMKVASKTYKE
ncbi:MAG: hypothetical protein KBT50_05080, partial [Cycloclasticus sp.]|nr:hypothetical protein [Cycloclasticus sp.]MBQ0789975.1 hypothetical protein [Cycloclasticus sp.]